MVNEFDLELFGSKNPVIWRRFLISDDCTFMEFHYALQILFDWQNCHMFCFKPERNRGNWLIADKRYEEPIDRNDIIEDAREVKLKDIFSPSRKVFFYNYDYGDNWQVKIALLHRHRKAYKGVRMSCRDGFGKAPPEDCGGLRGFQNLKNFFAGDPMEDPGVDYRYWLGLRDYETWDPYEFSVLAVDSDLMRLNRLLVEEGLYAFQKNR